MQFSRGRTALRKVPTSGKRSCIASRRQDTVFQTSLSTRPTAFRTQLTNMFSNHTRSLWRREARHIELQLPRPTKTVYILTLPYPPQDSGVRELSTRARRDPPLLRTSSPAVLVDFAGQDDGDEGRLAGDGRGTVVLCGGGAVRVAGGLGVCEDPRNISR